MHHTLLPLRWHIRRFPERRLYESRMAQRFGADSSSFATIMRSSDEIRDTHRGLKRKNEEPRLVHERRIGGIADYNNIDDCVVYVVGNLHDAPEDYEKEGWTFERIEKDYGQEIVHDVAHLKNPPRPPGMLDQEYWQVLQRQWRSGGYRVVLVKSFDRLESMLHPWKGGRERMLIKMDQTMVALIPLMIEFGIPTYQLVTAITMLQRRYGLHLRP